MVLCAWVLGSVAHAAELDAPIHLYILSFNKWGELQNPAERDLAISELREHPGIERIVIFSYGWAYDAEASYSTYRNMLDQLAEAAPDRPRPSTAVIAIAWDSSQTGFRKLFNNVIPLPGLANALAWLPDSLLFPLSFWSKSAQADRIGFGGLRGELNKILSIYEGRPSHPDLYLLGHSFGTRILSGLMVDQLGPVEVGSESFRARQHVRGAVLLQPALVRANLDHTGGYPTVVSMSQYDHALGFMYPIANLALNAYGFTLFEALVQKSVLRPAQRGMGAAVGTVAGSLSRSAGSKSESRSVMGPALSRTVRVGRRTLAELVALPLSLVFTAVSLPVDYAYIQFRGLTTRPLSHLMDSLAQLPLVEVPVELLDRAMHDEVRWGRRTKGIFTLGPLHEGLGRMVMPGILDRELPRVMTAEEFIALDEAPDGVVYIEASEIVRRGALGVNLGNPAFDFTIGWLDAIGAHGDYTNPEVAALAAEVLNPPAKP